MVEMAGNAMVKIIEFDVTDEAIKNIIIERDNEANKNYKYNIEFATIDKAELIVEIDDYTATSSSVYVDYYDKVDAYDAYIKVTGTDENNKKVVKDLRIDMMDFLRVLK